MTRKDQIICLILLAIIVSCAAVFMLVDLSFELKWVLGIVGILCWIIVIYIRRLKPSRPKSRKNHDGVA
jgi:hypothetical protein